MKQLGMAAALAAAFFIALWAISNKAPPTPDPMAIVSPATAEGTPLDSLLASGETLYWDGDFEAARQLWQNALVLSADVGDSAAYARALTWLGLAAYRLGQYEEATTMGEEALALKLRLGLHEDLARSYNALGVLALSQGRLYEAADLFEKTAEAAREVGDQGTLAKAANNLGLVYSDLGEFERARTGFIESVRAARELEDALIEGRALSNLGMLEARLGDPRAALVRFRQARARYDVSDDATGEQHTMGQLGFTYAALGEPRRAIAVLDSALALARVHGLRLEEASDLELIAEFHREAGDHRRALDFYRQAGEINAELGLTIEAGADLRNQALIYAALGDGDQARSMAEQALEIHRTVDADVEVLGDLLVLADLEPPPSARSLLAEARTLAERIDSRVARLDLALSEARLAVRAGNPRRALAALDGASADLAEAGYHVVAEVEALRARSYSSLGRLDLAVAAGRRALAAAERARASYGSGLLRTSFAHDQASVYADLVDILLAMGEEEEAFEVADAGRGRSLLEHLSAVPATAGSADGGTGTIAVIRRAEELLRRIDGLVSLVAEMESMAPEDRSDEYGDSMARLARRIRESRTEYEALLVRIREQEARAAMPLAGSGVPASEIRAALERHEAMIEYFVTPDRLVIFILTPAETQVIERAVDAARLARRARLARELSGSRISSAPSPAPALEALHSDLVGPVVESGALRDVRTLIIVPHEMLGSVPFAALRDPADGRYVVERFALTTLPSAAVLPALRNRSESPREEWSASVLVPFPDALRGTDAEGEAVRRTLDDVERIDGRRATESAARRALASGRILHIASHGILDVTNPFFSRMDLSPGDEISPQNDGRLEAHELLDLRIRSPLVFLSGCETGAGQAWSSGFARGEDYATLATALLYAGAANVVATSWRIDDRGAAAFAGRFYHHLLRRPPAEALALAQRDILRSSQYAAPYYWAGYRLSGAGGRAVDPSTRRDASAPATALPPTHSLMRGTR